MSLSVADINLSDDWSSHSVADANHSDEYSYLSLADSNLSQIYVHRQKNNLLSFNAEKACPQKTFR